MSKAWYTSLYLKPVIIAEPGEYKTRCGEIVVVSTVSTNHDHNCRGHYMSGISESWHKSGRLYFGIESTNDIIQKV